MPGHAVPKAGGDTIMADLEEGIRTCKIRDRNFAADENFQYFTESYLFQ